MKKILKIILIVLIFISCKDNKKRLHIPDDIENYTIFCNNGDSTYIEIIKANKNFKNDSGLYLTYKNKILIDSGIYSHNQRYGKFFRRTSDTTYQYISYIKDKRYGYHYTYIKEELNLSTKYYDDKLVHYFNKKDIYASNPNTNDLFELSKDLDSSNIYWGGWLSKENDGFVMYYLKKQFKLITIKCKEQEIHQIRKEENYFIIKHLDIKKDYTITFKYKNQNTNKIIEEVVLLIKQ